MARIIEPPRDQFDKLLTPLTLGERKVIDLFDEKLPHAWEIYVQPYLNGLRPDIVLLHPGIGIAVFEVKDWDLRAMHYYAESRGEDSLVLMARDKRGKTFSLQRENPINKILLYRDELYNLYCPRIESKAGLAVITAGLIFPYSRRTDIERVFSQFLDKFVNKADAEVEVNEASGVNEPKEYNIRKYIPLSGSEDIASGNLAAIFPESQRTHSWYMNINIADDLRGWLREPFFSREQRAPLICIDKKFSGSKLIYNLIKTRPATGYRRIKGPAGSGKSVILAARASELASEGKRVLVVCFNITLLNYLRDLAVRHVAGRKVVQSQIEFLNFHSWCRRVCWNTGHAEDYENLWKMCSEESKQSILEKELPELVKKIYLESESTERYDAILVDEGQDFRPEWWGTLRLALKKGGEMVLVADKTQNIYGTAGAWTENAMVDAGFRGPWVKLKASYRLPPAIVPHIRKFAEKFLPNEEIDIPEIFQRQLEFEQVAPVKLRWVQVSNRARCPDVCLDEVRLMMQQLSSDTANTDITVLAGTEMGRSIVRLFHGKIPLQHTFAEKKGESRRLKCAFFQCTAKIKATTLHSFKGWEARFLVVLVESIERPEDRALVYTALTRIKRAEKGSALTVVSCCDDLRTYGQSWPEYVEV